MAEARAIAHHAMQHVTKAARANLKPQPDDSHSNLGWDQKLKAFLSQAMDGKYIGLSLAPLSIFTLARGEQLENLALNNVDDGEVAQWLDRQMTTLGLNAGSITTLPYELPADVGTIESYGETRNNAALAALAAWFDTASRALDKFVADNADLIPGAGPVRCWPHHFDIATYVSLESGDTETARGIGVGMSPGDEAYGEPYFYVNPWPHPDRNALPDAIAPGHWHVEGYVGSIATATELLAVDNIEDTISTFIAGSFAAGRIMQDV